MIHDQLRQARIDRHLSRGQLSKLSGVPRERLRQIEAGANFTIETLLKLLPHLPDLKVIDLGPAELRVAGPDAGALRDELAAWLESGRRLLTTMERISIAPQPAAAGATRVEPGMQVPPELEERLRRLEAQVPQARAADERES